MTIIINILKISFVVKCLPGHKACPPPKGRYADLGTLSLFRWRKRAGSNVDAFGPQAAVLAWTDADGMARNEPLLSRCVAPLSSSMTLSWSRNRADMLLLWTRSTSLTNESRSGKALIT